MRTYLTVIDESPESAVALRFAARRAAKTGGAVQILTLIHPVEFVGLGSVQATMEEEARHQAEALAEGAAAMLNQEQGVHPSIIVEAGDPIVVIRRTLADYPNVAALVLGAAATGSPGPLVTHFAGSEAGQMPCPVMIVPGGLDNDALDRLS